METQIVRLDKPYNIICSNRGEFALHIATLIVVKESKDVSPKDPANNSLAVSCYPIVSKIYGVDGEPWMSSEVKDCLVIGRQGESVSLFTLKKVMEYCGKHNVSFYTEKIPTFFSVAMMQFESRIILNKDENKRIISNYVVCLEFEEENKGKSCMVYSSKDSDFYFYEYFDNEPPFFEGVPTNSEAIRHLAELRDTYLIILNFEGLRSITFTTNNEKYQWFVDQLNAYKNNAEGV